MLKKPEPKPPDDEVTQKLRTAARKRRPVTWKGLLLLLALLAVPAGLLVWWIYPKPEPPRLDVVAFDQLGLARQEVLLCAHLEPLDVNPAEVNLAGFAVFFEENRPPKPGPAQADWLKTTSNRDGFAAVSWTFPKGQGRTTF